MERIINSCLVTRVSTLLESQDSSLEYQKNVLCDFIKQQPNESFNPDTDIFADRISGTKIFRGENSDFNKLMELLGFKIVDNSKGDFIEISIVADKRIKPKYDKIYCKSTSRFSRASFKGENLLYILKQRGIEVYFYDLKTSTFTMSDTELKIYSLIDNQYSQKMSYSWKASNVYKTKYKKPLLRGKLFGYDNIKVDGEKYFIKNEKESKDIRDMIDMFLNQDKGCDLICQEMRKRGYTFDKSFINKLLKNRHYLGQEKYYDYPEDYLNNFDSDNSREYLKNLNFKWENCDYIEQIISEEEFNLIQEKLQSRSKQGRGIRSPFLSITKKLKCGICGKNFYSQGQRNYFNVRNFKCSTLRSGKGYYSKDCSNKTFYEDYLNDYLDTVTESFKDRQIKIYKQNLNQLLYLRVHLINILNSNTDNNLDDLFNKKEELEEQLEKIILQDLKSESSKKIIDKVKNQLDDELNLIDSKIKIYLDLKNKITESIKQINSLYSEIQKGYLSVIDKDKYTRDEVLNELEDITIYPKFAKGLNVKNAVYFIVHTKLENDIFNLVKDIYESDIKAILGEDIIKESDNNYIIEEPTADKLNQANALLEEMNLY